MQITMKQLISIGDNNDIIFPIGKGNKNKCSLSKKTRQRIEEDTEFSMVVNNNEDTDGRITIGFGDADLDNPEGAALDGGAFAIIIEQDTLKEMIDILQLVHNSCYE